MKAVVASTAKTYSIPGGKRKAIKRLSRLFREIMQTVNYPIEQLVFAEYNPRQLTKDQYQNLKDSITRFGLVDPMIVNTHKERKNILVGGHQRVKVAKDLGFEEVPCVEVKLTPDKEKELNIRLNKNTGEWDYDALANHFDVGELTEWGFTDDDLQFFEPEEIAGLIDDDEVPEVEESITKTGDIWILGEHRVLCGDATKKEDVERLMDGQKADMVFTDPPYAIYGSSTGVNSNIADDKMVRPFFRSLFLAYQKNTKEYSHFYICCDWRSWGSFWEISKDVGIQIKNMIVWDKESPGMGSMYQNQHELLLFATNTKRNTAFMSQKKKTNKRHRLVAGVPNVWKIKREKHGTHNAQKPVELCSLGIENSSDANSMILDFFLGSGSTLIACEKINRKCYGIEINPHYCDVIVKRWEDYTGKKAERMERVES